MKAPTQGRTDEELEALIDAAYQQVIDPAKSREFKQMWFVAMANLIRQRSPEQVLKMETQMRAARNGNAT